jgi:hypothetical protein
MTDCQGGRHRANPDATGQRHRHLRRTVLRRSTADRLPGIPARCLTRPCRPPRCAGPRRHGPLAGALPRAACGGQACRVRRASFWAVAVAPAVPVLCSPAVSTVCSPARRKSVVRSRSGTANSPASRPSWMNRRSSAERPGQRRFAGGHAGHWPARDEHSNRRGTPQRFSPRSVTIPRRCQPHGDAPCVHSDRRGAEAGLIAPLAQVSGQARIRRRPDGLDDPTRAIFRFSK